MKFVIAVIIVTLVALLLITFDGSHTAKPIDNTQCQLEHCPTF